jgi:hypothetical protein
VKVGDAGGRDPRASPGAYLEKDIRGRRRILLKVLVALNVKAGVELVVWLRERVMVVVQLVR